MTNLLKIGQSAAKLKPKLLKGARNVDPCSDVFNGYNHMEESTASYLASMRKAHYEAQEREMAWDPTSYHGFECTSTYQEELPYGNYFQEDQYGYGESYKSWDKEYGYEETYDYEEASPSPSYEQEEIYNLLKLVLEGQESFYKNISTRNDALEVALERNSKDLNNQENSMDEGMLMNYQEEIPIIISSTPKIVEDPSSFTLPCVIEEKEHKYLSCRTMKEFFNSWEEESDETPLMDLETSSSISEECNEVGKNKIEDYPLSELNAPKDELKYLPKEDTFLQEAEKTLQELELLLNCKIDENCVIRYGNPCEDDVVVECMEDIEEKSIVENELSTKENMQVKHMVKQETKVAKPLKNQNNLIKVVYKEYDEEESPKAKPFSKHLGIILTIKLGINDRWKLSFFEEVRMKEFRGWFYDEYDPGDPSSCHTPFLKSKRSLLSGRVSREDSAFRSYHHIKSGAFRRA